MLLKSCKIHPVLCYIVLSDQQVYQLVDGADSLIMKLCIHMFVSESGPQPAECGGAGGVDRYCWCGGAEG